VQAPAADVWLTAIADATIPVLRLRRKAVEVRRTMFKELGLEAIELRKRLFLPDDFGDDSSCAGPGAVRRNVTNV
jgi:hypothetical protein